MLVCWLLQGWMLHSLSSGCRLARCGMVPINCGCLHGQLTGSWKAPRRGSAAHGWRRPACPSDPPSGTAVGTQGQDTHHWINPQALTPQQLFKIEDELWYRNSTPKRFWKHLPALQTNRKKKILSGDFVGDSIHSTNRWQLWKWSLLL